MATGVTAACLTVLLLAPRLARAVPGSELLQPLAQLRVSSMANLVLLSVTAFALEGLFFAGVMQLLHVEFDARLLCTCVIAATAGQALSWLPASLGTYELTLAGAMAIAGVSGDALWQIPVVTHALRFSAHAFLLPTVMLCRPRQLAMPVSSLPVSESTL